MILNTKKLHYKVINYVKCLFCTVNKTTNYNTINDIHFNELTSIVGSNNYLSNYKNKNNNLDKYNIDWLNKYKGCSKLVLKPSDKYQIQKIVKYCYLNNIAIVPQGGNTGLVGGSIPVFDEIIVSTERLNKIVSLDEQFCYNSQHSLFNTNNFQKEYVIHTESGVILEEVNDKLESINKVFPLDLAAKGSCTVGGNIATNAGGIHFIKYGSLKNNCVEITLINGKGDIINLNENNEYFNLKNLVIGSEGTLGIISDIKVKTYKKDLFKNLMLIRLPSFEYVKDIYKQVKLDSQFINYISAIEFFDSKCKYMTNKYLNLDFPELFNKTDNKINNDFYLLLEVSSDNEEFNNNLLIEFINNLSTNYNQQKFDIEYNVLLCQDINQFNSIWALRERIAEAGVKKGLCLKYDISLNLDNMYEIVNIIEEKVNNLADVIGYGHVGDNNLHLNICLEGYEKNSTYYKVLSAVEPFIFEYLKSVNGSISAEHGIGQSKSKYLTYTQSETNVNLMKKIKHIFDPNSIMNPYKIFI